MSISTRATNSFHRTAVYLDGKYVGSIHQVTDGYYYKPKNSAERGATFPTMASCKLSLESPSPTDMADDAAKAAGAAKYGDSNWEAPNGKNVKVGDEITLSRAADATWFRVTFLDGFKMGLREVKGNGTTYDNEQWSDTSLVRKHRRRVGVVDLTPKWADLLPFFVAAIRAENTTSPAYENAITELGRMAALADAYVEQGKKLLNKR